MRREIKSHINWIDILSPSDEDLQSLQKKFNLHPILINELRVPSTRSKIEIYDKLMFIVYYFSHYNEQEKTSEAIEVDFLICGNNLVTVRYQNYQPLEDIFDAFQKIF